MKKVVLKLEIKKGKIKKKAMKAVLGLSGLESFSVDMKEKILTLIRDIDPVKVVAKLRKFCHAEIISVGPKDSTIENVINPMFHGAGSTEGDPRPNRSNTSEKA
ncbi:heavy metal-associated isoprenylated plant protein 39-like [Vicia villosa]|uniref:heavy metal-associated isoprenylated plant protein 39-like n=1 Tax=Vicia villosa TaxID=3911 RepID=UPI00273AD147|nr:heavy metal-associated isoprenylated plant protein 39-like [Vicia villosa]